MKQPRLAGYQVLCVGLLLSLISVVSVAQDAPPAVERPVYVHVIPVAQAGDSLLPEDTVAAMAREALAGARQASIRMSGKTLPADVRVLRIMYIVHRQPDETGLTLAASASTELLRTVDTGNGEMQTFSVYNGLQQTLVTAADIDRGQQLLRAAFKKELQARIDSAFQNAEAL